VDIHEYQAKALLADFGMPIARGGIAYSPEQAAYRAKELGGEKWVVKAQIHSGARGKAGGIRVCSSEDEVMEAANALLGRCLVTNQTGPQGKLIGRLYIEEATKSTSRLCSIALLNASSASPPRRAEWTSRKSPRPIPMPSCAYRSNRRSGCRISRRAKSPLHSAWRRRSSPRR